MSKRISFKMVGHDWITLFENKDKKDDKHPDFKGDGCALWIHEYEDKKSVVEEKF